MQAVAVGSTVKSEGIQRHFSTWVAHGTSSMRVHQHSPCRDSATQRVTYNASTLSAESGVLTVCSIRDQVLGCRSSLLCECVRLAPAACWVSCAKGCRVGLSRGLPALLVVKSVADLELADVPQVCPPAREVQDQVRRLLPIRSHVVAVKFHCAFGSSLAAARQQLESRLTRACVTSAMQI